MEAGPILLLSFVAVMLVFGATQAIQLIYERMTVNGVRKFVEEWVQEKEKEDRHMVTHDLGRDVFVTFYTTGQRGILEGDLRRMEPIFPPPPTVFHKDYLTAYGFEPGVRYVAVVIG